MNTTVEFKYELGIEARDRVTGIEGILDMRAEYINGCIRYSLQPKAEKPNPLEAPKSYWVDEAQLEKIGEGLNENPVEKTPTGGPTESSTSAKM